MKRINILIIILAAIAPLENPIIAQVKTPKAKFDLEDANSLDEIMTVVEDHYYSKKTKSEKDESDLKKWKRWEWYLSSHLGPNGEFVDIGDKLWRASKEMQSYTEETNRSIHSSWTSIGPSTSPLANPEANYNGIGRVSRVAFHPSNSNIIYIGTPFGGLWRSQNGGTSWTPLTDHLPSLSVSGIVISHANPDHIYILTGDGDGDYNGVVAKSGHFGVSLGVLKSLDGGESWSETGPMSPLGPGYQLAQDPNDADVLIAATSEGIFRTSNGGDNWIRSIGSRCYDINFKPGSSDTVYATLHGQFVLSKSNGVFWSNYSTFDPPITDGGRMQLAVTPVTPETVYLVAGPSDTAEFKGLWKSTNSGLDFVRQSNTPNVLGRKDDGSDSKHSSHYNLALAAATNSANKISVAANTVWRSGNGGIYWTKSTSYSEDGGFEYIHPDVHDLQYNPLNHHLYAANDGGLYKSTDHGVTWTDLSAGIRTTMFFHMRTWNGVSPKMLAGCQDNGIKYRRTATTAWHHISQADGFDVVFNPLNGEPGYGTTNKGIDKYLYDGDSSQSITPSWDSVWFKTVAVHNTRPDTVLLGSEDINYSYDGGDSWTNAGYSGSWAITSCPSNNSKFYSAGGIKVSNGDETNSGAYVSTDIGQTWDTISTNPGFPTSWTKITDIVPNPINSHTVYATFGGFGTDEKVFRSYNSGQEWTNITDNLPDVAVLCIAVDSDNSLYLGTDIGAFYRKPEMAGWMPWSNGLPNTPVTDISIQNSFVRCSTFGRGAFQSLKPDACTQGLALLSPLVGDHHYETSVFINSTSNITSGLGTFVSFKAGNRVDLKAGFEVADGSKFLAQIGPCGTGGIPSIWYPGSDGESAIRGADNVHESDIKHAFPLGSIDHVERNGNTAMIEFTVRTKGKIDFVLYQNGNKTPLHSVELKKGSCSVQLETEGIKSEFYTLIMYNDDRVAHTQEFVIE